MKAALQNEFEKLFQQLSVEDKAKVLANIRRAADDEKTRTAV